MSNSRCPHPPQIEDLRRRIQQHFQELRDKPRLVPPSPAPRYDLVFFEGTQWLNKV